MNYVYSQSPGYKAHGLFIGADSFRTWSETVSLNIYQRRRMLAGQILRFGHQGELEASRGMPHIGTSLDAR